MKRIKYLFLVVLSCVLSFCSNDDNSVDETQNPDVNLKFIGEYPEKWLFNSDPKYNINDYGAYYYITQKNKKNGILTNWLVDYNLHNRKNNTYFEIISTNQEGIIMLNGYYELVDGKGNWIYGDGPDFMVDFTKKGVIRSTEHPLHIFYY